MLPNPSGSRRSRSSSQGKLPKPENGGDFDPFLKAEDIGKLGKQAKIAILGGPEETESEFSDALLPVKYRGQEYVLGIKWSGGNYARLYKRFGDNPKKWRGTVTVEVKHFKKNDYVAVV